MDGAPPGVSILGGGVAAATCAHLLASDGCILAGAATGAGAALPAPVVMLSDGALRLLRDLHGRPDCFTRSHRIVRRVVSWGGGEAKAVAHGAVAVSGSELAAELAMPVLPPRDELAGFTIHAAPPFPEPALRRFGSREAVAAGVALAAEADPHAGYVEAVPSGWLFLIPQGRHSGWLLGVGDALEALLDESRLIRAQIAAMEPVAARFETAPRMLERLSGPGWLACGTAAIAFDPICGDGTAQAAREAVLASAVVTAIREGGDIAALLGHYQAMLTAAMRRHLQVSLPFYRSGGDSPWWQAQADALSEGHAWCTARLAVTPEPRYLLEGTRLVLREAAA